jgi:ankyrin repeat protein
MLHNKIDMFNCRSNNTKSTIGITPLFIAAYNGRTDVVKFLLDSGADASVSNIHGRTALMEAETKGYTAIVQMIKAVDIKKSSESNAQRSSDDAMRSQK